MENTATRDTYRASGELSPAIKVDLMNLRLEKLEQKREELLGEIEQVQGLLLKYQAEAIEIE